VRSSSLALLNGFVIRDSRIGLTLTVFDASLMEGNKLMSSELSSSKIEVEKSSAIVLPVLEVGLTPLLASGLLLLLSLHLSSKLVRFSPVPLAPKISQFKTSFS
jgi:hypothetical protein